MLCSRTPPPSLQQVYDESYLACSTAAYYEIQGNEAEAMRCWKSALDQIHDHHTNNPPANYTIQSEAEKILAESLYQLESQCKERIDILEALRLSREENPSLEDMPSPNMNSPLPPEHPEQSQPQRGWIGGGTIPAVSYPELSRPILPPRPPLPPRKSPEQAAVGSSKNSGSNPGSSLPSSATKLPTTPAPPSAAQPQPSRSPSPERYTMRTTLRSNKPGEKSSKQPSKRSITKPAGGPGASKAASLAWSALGLRDKPGQSTPGRSSPNQVISPRDPPEPQRRAYDYPRMQWDSNTRRLVAPRPGNALPSPEERRSLESSSFRRSDEFPFPQPCSLSVSAASSALNSVALKDLPERHLTDAERAARHRSTPLSGTPARFSGINSSPADTASQADYGPTPRRKFSTGSAAGRDAPSPSPSLPLPTRETTTPRPVKSEKPANTTAKRKSAAQKKRAQSLSSTDDAEPTPAPQGSVRRGGGEKQREPSLVASNTSSAAPSSEDEDATASKAWKKRKARILKNLPQGVDEHAAKQILNEIVVKGDEVHWGDVAGLEIAKNALREAVVYPFLRPDLFKGLREPARGMLLFGPPGTGKTMLARAVATESRSTFFSISASSLTSKYLGESEKLVRALFSLARALAPSIIFVDEIDSLLSQRSGSGEHEATRRIKTEFLIQWSNLQRAAAGRESGDKHQDQDDANRVLVLAATNMPWAIDEAARRRFVRRQYIPLPESATRATQLKTLLGQQMHSLTDADIESLVESTDGFSGSDITALAKDAAMGPIRSLGDALLQMSTDEIRPIEHADFRASLETIRPSVSKAGLEAYEKWAKEFGERGG